MNPSPNHEPIHPDEPREYLVKHKGGQTEIQALSCRAGILYWEQNHPETPWYSIAPTERRIKSIDPDPGPGITNATYNRMMQAELEYEIPMRQRMALQLTIEGGAGWKDSIKAADRKKAKSLKR